MAQDYSPSLVTKNLVFCGDAAMKSAAGPATLLYDKVNNNNGTMYNGTCLDFDGTDDTVSFGYSSDYIMNGPCTIVVIFTGDGNLTGSTDWRDTLFSNDQSSSFGLEIGAFSGCGIGDTDGFRFLIHRQGNCFSAVSEANAYTRYAVTFFAYTRDSSNAEKMYVDGQEISMQQDNAYTFSAGSSTSYIGTRGTGLTQDLDGQVHDLKIFSKELSAANIKELYDDSKVIIPTKNDASGGFVSQTDLKLWVPLSEGAGLVAYDGSGNGSEGTIANASWLTGQTGCPQLVEGYNRPMTFDGASDYLKCGDVGNFTGSLSVSFWFYANTNGVSSRLIAKDMASGGAPRWLIYKSTSPSLILYFDDNVNTAAATSASFSTYETWHHFAATITSGEQKIYIDGASVGAVDTQTTSSFTTDNDLWIGRYASSSYFDGIINEVVLYDSVLTLAQVQVLAATGPNGGPLPPNPMSLSNSSDVTGYWRNDGNVTWADRSGNGYTGTVYGSPPSVLFKQGYNGQKNVNTGRDNQGFPLKFKNVGAIGFNGSSDYIQPSQSLSGPLVSTTGALDFWINFVDSDAYRGLYYLYDNGYSDYFILRGEGSGNLKILAETGNSSIISHDTDLSSYMGEWINLVYTQDGTTIRIYVDGVEIDSVASTVWTGHLSATPVCKIGYSAWASNYLNAALASVRVYNRNLTYAEIQQNYNSFKNRFGK